MQDFQKNVLEINGFKRGRGQVYSQNLRLSGFQCQPGKDLVGDLQRLFSLISDMTGRGFNSQQFKDLELWTSIANGKRKREYVSVVKKQGLDNFLESNLTFSYAIQSNTVVNYTTEIDGD